MSASVENNDYSAGESASAAHSGNHRAATGLCRWMIVVVVGCCLGAIGSLLDACRAVQTYPSAPGMSALLVPINLADCCVLIACAWRLRLAATSLTEQEGRCADSTCEGSPSSVLRNLGAFFLLSAGSTVLSVLSGVVISLFSA